MVHVYAARGIRKRRWANMLSRMPAVCEMMQVPLRVCGKPGQEVEAPSKGSCHVASWKGEATAFICS